MGLEELYTYLSESKIPLAADDIYKIIELRKSIPENLWKNNFHYYLIEHSNQKMWMGDLKKIYYDTLTNYLELNLLSKNKLNLIAMFEVLPKEDFIQTMGEIRVGDFIDEQLKKQPLNPENIGLLLSPELNYTRELGWSSEAVSLLGNMVFSNSADLVPLLLKKYPTINSKDIWAGLYSATSGGLAPNFNKIHQLLIADDHNHLKGNYNTIFTQIFFQGFAKIFESYNKSGELSEKEHITFRECLPILRILLNKGVQLDENTKKWLSTFVKWPLFCEALPEPKVTDTGYKQFYHVLMTLRKNHLLAHRMDILGESEIEGIKIEMHGSYPQIMMPEARKSFASFLESHLDEIVKGRVYESDIIDENKFRKAILEAQQDLSAVLMTDKENEITAIQSNNIPVYIPVTVRSQRGFHQIAVSIGNDLCLICDRARDEKSGIEIYKVGTTEATKLECIKKLGKTVPAARMAPYSYANVISQELASTLNLIPLDYIERSEQYGENCTWNSSAKMIIFSALYLRFYQLAKDNNMSQEEALNFAKVNANPIYKKWSKFDKKQFLINYLNTYLVDENNKYGPDTTLLSMIYLRNEYKPKYKELTDLLRNSGYINEQTLAQAQKQMYQMAEFIINDSLPRGFSHENPELMKKMINSLTEYFIRTDKKTVNEVFFVLEEKIKSGRLDEIPTFLDNAMAELEGLQTQNKVGTVLHQYAGKKTAKSQLDLPPK
ncbi:MAG TPA: hypothetical protein VFP93_03030, partial [Gammaproteobacteria bacterium]|nr:hypothetical protein [Gammaproteobacteria bacterium]